MERREEHSQKDLGAQWAAAHRELLRNVKKKPFVSEYECSVHANVDGRKVYLPAYIPYIGPRYFKYRPRVLCYAINQNLSPHVPWTEEWVNCWAADVEYAEDRLNRAALEDRAIPIRPYAEGFVPLVALLAIVRWTQSRGGSLPRIIDEVVAVTNFVKFSTPKDASSSSIPKSWWRECGSQYVQHEIQLLRPDIIIGFGQKTAAELRRVLNGDHLLGWKGELLRCRFPARMPSIKSRPLSSQDSKVWNSDIVPLISKMREPKQKCYHRWRIQRFPGYFIDVGISWGHAL